MKRSKDKLTKELTAHDRHTFDERLLRLRFVAEVVDRTERVEVPVLAVQFFEEAKVCFVNGAFAACIMMCQLSCEEMLKSPYRSGGLVDVVEFNFSKLINRARDDGHISDDEAEELHSVREITNELKHTKDYSRLSVENGFAKTQLRRSLYSFPANAAELERMARSSFETAYKLLDRGYLLT